MFYYRREYSYVRQGKMVFVPATWCFREPSNKSRDRSERKPSRCPMCGANIDVRRYKNGSWGFYEVGMSHLGTRHPCFTLGRGLGPPQNGAVRDLFDPAIHHEGDQQQDV